MFIFSSFSPHNYSEANTRRIQFAVKMAFKCSINRDFSLTWSAAMQICLNKRQLYLTKKDQLPKDWFEAPKWPLFHGLGTTICRDVVRKRFIIVDVKTEF